MTGTVIFIKDGEQIRIADPELGGLAKDKTLQQTNNILTDISNVVNDIDNKLATESTLQNLVNAINELNNLLKFKSFANVFSISKTGSNTILNGVSVIKGYKIHTDSIRGIITLKLENSGDIIGVLYCDRQNDTGYVEMHMELENSDNVVLEYNDVSLNSNAYVLVNYL